MSETIVTRVVSMYDDLMAAGDPRVTDWFMMDSPWPGLFICLFYVWLVQYGLPKFMENRQPYELRNFMLFYNFAMVALSGYIFMEFALSGWFAGYSLGCQPVDYSNSPQATRMARACWWFFFSKYIELLDTVIFVLRKKTNQVTFLHVFHHGIMPFSWWFGVKYVAGGLGTFHAFLNSWIHFMMYIYYGVAGLGPKYQKYLWWKKYMTSMQITQFVACIVHSSQLLFTECNYPQLFVYWVLSYAVIFFFLFADFYRKAYQPKSKKSPSDSNGVTNGVVTNGNYKKSI